ncbi:tetratricopeptide repeat-containing sensor histidine kinase [Ferruginibacter sp.]
MYVVKVMCDVHQGNTRHWVFYKTTTDLLLLIHRNNYLSVITGSMRKIILIGMLLLRCFFVKAQSDSVARLVARLEKNNDSKAVIAEINVILKKATPSTEDKLAIQTSLVHKYQELQQWDTCLEYCQQQVAAAHLQNNTLAEASFYKLIGNTYYHIPDKDKAITYWEKCIALSEPNRFNVLLEHSYHNIASVYIERNYRMDIAETYLLKAIGLSIAGNTAATVLGRLHYRLLATLYERTDQLIKAAQLYDTVITQSRIAHDSANLSEALMFCSNVLVKQKKYKEALELNEEALHISRMVNKLDMVQTALEFYSRNLYAAGNYKAAYEYQDTLNALIATRYKGDLSNKISEAEAKFKTAEAEHEKALAVIAAKKQQQLYILGLVGLFAISALLLYNFTQKRNAKQKAQLQLQLQEEKERLSRDLHDNLGSQMALLSNNIETLDINFKKQQDVDTHIEKVKNTAKQLLQTLRETIWILNKEQVTAQEFFDKLIDYAQRYMLSYPLMKLKTAGECRGDKLLNSNEALQLFRICQEAITNACKYSGSEILLLQADSTAEIFTVKIADTGKGFDNTAIDTGVHYGLKNMQQRAASIHAAIKIAAEKDKGVSITITI